jgi:hypothetical protein
MVRCPQLSTAQQATVASIEAEHASRALARRAARLQIYVLAARKLPKMDRWGKADPYVLVRPVQANRPDPTSASNNGGPPVDGDVCVRVIGAKGLLPADKNGKSDPYVKLQLCGTNDDGKEQKTKSQKETLDPTFDEEFRFGVKTLPADSNSTTTAADWRIELEVKDADSLGRDEFIGGCDVSLADLDWRGLGGSQQARKRHTVKLLDRNGRIGDKVLAKSGRKSGVLGEISFEISFENTPPRLGLSNLGQVDLELRFEPAPPDCVPAVKGLQQQTTVMKGNLDPEWGELCELDLPATLLKSDSHTQLQAVVYDWDRLGSDCPIAEVTLSVADIQRAGKGGYGGWYALKRTSGGPTMADGLGLGELKLQCTIEPLPQTAADAQREAEDCYEEIAQRVFIPLTVDVMCAQPPPVSAGGSTVVVQYQTVSGSTGTGTSIRERQFVMAEGAVRFEMRPGQVVQLQRIPLKLIADPSRFNDDGEPLDEFFTVRLGLAAATMPSDVDVDGLRKLPEPTVKLHPTLCSTVVSVLPPNKEPPADDTLEQKLEEATMWAAKSFADRWVPWSGEPEHVCNRCGRTSHQHLDGTLWEECLADHGPPAEYVCRPRVDGVRSVVVAMRRHQAGWLSRPTAAVEIVTRKVATDARRQAKRQQHFRKLVHDRTRQKQRSEVLREREWDDRTAASRPRASSDNRGRDSDKHVRRTHIAMRGADSALPDLVSRNRSAHDSAPSMQKPTKTKKTAAQYGAPILTERAQTLHENRKRVLAARQARRIVEAEATVTAVSDRERTRPGSAAEAMRRAETVAGWLSAMLTACKMPSADGQDTELRQLTASIPNGLTVDTPGAPIRIRVSCHPGWLLCGFLSLSD